MSDNSFDRISQGLAAKSSRRQAFKLVGGGLLGGALVATGLTAATAQQSNPFLIPFTTDVDETIASLLITGFQNNGGTLTALGSVLDAAGEVIGSFTANATEADGTCQILNLTLGPIFLDLLGLVVEVPDEIVVNIFADPGAGKLLGNLLCAVTNLLNGGGPLGALAGLLNRILSILG